MGENDLIFSYWSAMQPRYVSVPAAIDLTVHFPIPGDLVLIDTLTSRVYDITEFSITKDEKTVFRSLPVNAYPLLITGKKSIQTTGKSRYILSPTISSPPPSRSKHLSVI